MKVKYDRAEVNVNKICQDAGRSSDSADERYCDPDKMYDLNLTLF